MLKTQHFPGSLTDTISRPSCEDSLTIHNRQRTVPILMYHSLSRQAREGFRLFTVAPEAFAEQMDYIQAQGYSVLSVTQYITLLKQRREALPERPLIITFDDGFADFYMHALPILRDHHFPATLYITTSFIGGKSQWLWKEGEAERPILSWEQIQEIHRSGIECGAHSHTHPQLDLLPLQQVKQEVIRSKELLEDHLQQAVHSFAYPHGHHTAMVQQIVRGAGFSSACAVKYQMCRENDDHFALPRLLIGPDTTIAEFARLLEQSPDPFLVRTYKSARVPVGRVIRKYTEKFRGEKLRYANI